MEDENTAIETETGRSYIAFISYRHKPLDKEAAERIQKKIESYVVPKEFRAQVGGKKLGMVFRDEDELPASSSLTDSIYYALDHSKFLIVICTPDLPLSQWCEQEIRYFLKTHDRDHVLAVLTDGDPAESFSPYLLHTFDDEGNITGDTEPLAANIAGGNHTINNKAFKKEIVRLYAALIGCPFDALWQRERRARTNRLLMLAGVAMAVMAVFLGVVLNRNARIKEQNAQILEQNDQITAQSDKIEEQNKALQTQLSSVLVDSGLSKLENFDVNGALEDAAAAVGSDDPAIYDHRALKLFADSLNAYHHQELVKSIVYKQSTDITQMAVTDDNTRLIVKDRAGLIRCLSMSAFDVQWEIRTDDVKTMFTVKNLQDRLIYKSNAGIYCVSLKDGSQLWSYEHEENRGNYFWAVSGDAGLVAVAERFGNAFWSSGDPVSAIFFETKDGKEAGRAELVKEDRVLQMSDITEADQFSAAFASDNSLFVCSFPSESAEKEAESGSYDKTHGDTFFIVDLKTFETIPLGTTASHSFMYGVDIDPADRSVFLAGYSTAANGIHVGLLTWDGGKQNFSGDTATHSFSSPGGINAGLHEPSDNETTFLSKNGRVFIFSDNQLFIFNRADHRLSRSYTLSGKVISAGWKNDSNILEVASSDGYILDYDMNFDKDSTYIFSEMRGETIHTGIKKTLSINGGIVYTDDGYLLVVPESTPGQILRVEYESDPNASVFDMTDSDYRYTDDVVVETGFDNGFFLCDGKKAKAFDKKTGEIIKTVTYDDYLSGGRTYSVGADSFVMLSKKYNMDGTVEPYGTEVALSDYSSAAPFHHTRLSDGSLLSWSLADPYSIFSSYSADLGSSNNAGLLVGWIDGKPVAASTDPETGIFVLDPVGSDEPVVGGGANGLLMAYGSPLAFKGTHLYSVPEKTFFFIDVYSGKVTKIGNACPDSGSFMTAFAGKSKKMAAVYDDGSLCFYDAEAGTAEIADLHYSPKEVFSFAYDRDDTCFVVLTSGGRLDIYDAASMQSVFSGTPDILKDWSSEHIGSDMSLSKLKAEMTSEGNYLYVTAANDSYTYGVLIDIEGKCVVAEFDNVYAYDADTNRIYCSKNGKVIAYQVYDLKTLRSWAAEKLAGNP